MIINIKSVGMHSREQLAILAESLDVAAILTDENTKVIMKNAHCSRIVCGLRKGSKLSRFLEDGVEETVKDMLPREVLSARFNTDDEEHGVIIISGFDSRLFVFNPLGSEMFARIEELYSRMSGFDNEEIEFGTKEDTKVGTNPNSRKIARILSDMLDGFKKARSLPFFNANDIIDLICDTVSKSGKTAKQRLVSTVSHGETITQGNSHDMALILSFAISFCFDHGEDSKILVNTEHIEDEAVFTVSSRTSLSVYDLARITAIHKFTGDTNDKNFWFYMIRLLADANLWSFSSEAAIDGTVAFTLKTPLIQNVEEYLLRDQLDEEIIEIIKIFFDI